MCRKLFFLTIFILLAFAGNASAAMMVEDFECYTSTAQLRAFSRIPDCDAGYYGGSRTGNAFDGSNFYIYLDLTDANYIGTRSMRLESIVAADANGAGWKIGREPGKSSDLWNWSAGTAIRIWVKPGHIDPNFIETPPYWIFRFREQDGDWWITATDTYYLADLDPNGEYITLDLNTTVFSADGGTGANGIMELDDPIAIQVHCYGGGNASGTGSTNVNDYFEFWIDEIYVLVPSATNPDPPDDGTVTELSPTLSWTAGDFTQTSGAHKIYFSSDFDDVNDGIVSPVTQDLGNESYAPGALESGRRYYWRIDEINGPNTWTGNVWAFTVGGDLIDDFESYADTTALDVVWDEPNDGWDEPNGATFARTLDTTGGIGGSQAIKLDFDPNGTVDANGGIGYNFSDVGPEARNWTAMNGIRLWIKATGAATTDPNFVFRVQWYDFNDRWRISLDLTLDPNYTSGKYVFIPWYDFGDYGGYGADGMQLNNAERVYLRFDYTGSAPSGSSTTVWVDDVVAIIDSAYASASDPGTRTTIEEITPTLSWTAGDSAQDVNAHDVYLGTNWYSLHNADKDDPNNDATYQGSQNIGDTNYPSLLAFETTYYWRIDEVNAAEANSPWRGNVWSFTTPDYHTVDHFNDYADTNDMNSTWTADGGATIALEADVVGNTSQTIRIDYNNTGSNSWAWRMPEDADWTMADIRALSVMFVGDAGNDPLPVFVEITDGTTIMAVTLNDANGATDVDATQLTGWQGEWTTRWLIDLDDFTGVDLTSVTEVRLGVGDGATAGAGTVHFDAIRLYQSRCLESTPDVMDFNGDCTVDFRDLATLLGEWLKEQWF